MSDDLQRAVGQLEGTVGALVSTVSDLNAKLDPVLAHIAAQKAISDEQKAQHARRSTVFGAIAGAIAGAAIKLVTLPWGHS